MINLQTIYSQTDNRWGQVTLGLNPPNQGWTIYNYGCLLSCLSIVARYFGKEVDPLKMNDLLKQVSAFPQGSGDYIWGGLTKVYGDIKETLHNTPNLLTDTQINEIKTNIDNGYPVIIQLDHNPSTVKNDTHYVVIVGYNPSDENDFTIADPFGGRLRSLKDYLGWFRPSARKTIEQYITYLGPKIIDCDVICNKMKQELIIKILDMVKNLA